MPVHVMARVAAAGLAGFLGAFALAANGNAAGIGTVLSVLVAIDLAHLSLTVWNTRRVAKFEAMHLEEYD